MARNEKLHLVQGENGLHGGALNILFNRGDALTNFYLKLNSQGFKLTPKNLHQSIFLHDKLIYITKPYTLPDKRVRLFVSVIKHIFQYKIEFKYRNFNHLNISDYN